MTRRTVVRSGAVVLALLGVVALLVRPHRDTRAEARVTVPTALDVNEVVSAIRTDAVGATVTADGRRITVAFRDDDASVARTYATVLARGGLDAARKQENAVQTRRAEAARSESSQATSFMAANAERTGIDDPESAYQERVERGRELEDQRAAAAAAGQSTRSIENALAENQQEAAELQLLVTRRAELIETVNAADGRALVARRAIDTTDRAVRAASVRVSAQETGFGFGVLPGIAILVIAGLAMLVNELVPRRAASREAEIDIRSEPVPAVITEPEPVMMSEPEPVVRSEPEPVPAIRKAPKPAIRREPMSTVNSTPEPAFDKADKTDDDDGRDPTRLSRFYRALEPSAPPLEVDLTSPVDLVDEEIREVNGDLEQQGIGERPREPQEAGEANATRFSR